MSSVDRGRLLEPSPLDKARSQVAVGAVEALGVSDLLGHLERPPKQGQAFIGTAQQA